MRLLIQRIFHLFELEPRSLVPAIGKVRSLGVAECASIPTEGHAWRRVGGVEATEEY